MAFTCTAIVGPSIARSPSYSEYTFDDYKFIIESCDFNYYYFLQKEYIEDISYLNDDKNIIKIKLNRFSIRSCDERYIYININTNVIIHINEPLSGPTSEWYHEDILDDTKLKFILVSKNNKIEDNILNYVLLRYLVYPIVIGGGMIGTYLFTKSNK